MKISTKGRYALRVMIDLAEHDNGEYITLMDIAERQGISEKYLESIVSLLSKNDFLISLRGKGGGYKLSRRPEEYTVLSVLQCTEGSLAPVACLESKPNKCPKLEECKTITMWEQTLLILVMELITMLFNIYARMSLECQSGIFYVIAGFICYR